MHLLCAHKMALLCPDGQVAAGSYRESVANDAV